MHNLNRTPHNFKIEERRRQIASLLSKSMTETQIANELGVDQSTIAKTGKSMNDSKNDGYNFWNRRKIVPLSEWKKIANTNYAFGHGIEHLRTKEAFKYLPDDYSAYLFLLGVPDNAREEAEKWLSDYLDLMEFKKNVNYGKTKCSGCPLDPEMDGSTIFNGFNRIVAKGLVVIADVKEQEKEEGQEEEGKGENEESKDDTTQTLEIQRETMDDDNKEMRARSVPYPCSVYNRFECPYEKDKVIEGENANFDVDTLFYLQEVVVFPMEQAFSHMKSICVSNGLIYEADFANSKVKEQEFDYYGDPFPYPKEYGLEEGLSKVQRLAKIKVTDATEMYNTLIDENQLAVLLEERLTSEYLQYKDQIIRFFTYIRDRVSIEDLLKVCGASLPSETRRKKNECSICKSFANIHCVNCEDNNTWLCVDHGRDHRSEHISGTKI
jgi:hypothetical protein